MATIAYEPAASGWPATVIASLVVNVVGSFAPARHGLSQGRSPPQIVRPFTPGREYVIDRSVMPICCVVEAFGETRGSTRSARAEAAPSAAAAAITPTTAANTKAGDRRAGFMRQSSMDGWGWV